MNRIDESKSGLFSLKDFWNPELILIIYGLFPQINLLGPAKIEHFTSGRFHG